MAAEPCIFCGGASAEVAGGLATCLCCAVVKRRQVAALGRDALRAWAPPAAIGGRPAGAPEEPPPPGETREPGRPPPPPGAAKVGP